MSKGSLEVLYRGSVKDVLGPVQLDSVSAIVFEYSDAYSVFDWGKMPDSLPCKGEALAVLAAHWFEQMSRPETWKDFSRSPEALNLRKGNRFGAGFNEVGEKLQLEGLKHHYLGLVPSTTGDQLRASTSLDLKTPVRHLLARQVNVVKPKLTQVLKCPVPDYREATLAPAPKLVPLEVVFRFSCPPGSSLRKRVQADPEYLTSRGFSGYTIQDDADWPFPVVELFTKLEPTDRPVGLAEALMISGLKAEQLQQIVFGTVWVAAWLRSECARHGIELADGKLEWAINDAGHPFLVDAVGPDELRLLKDGVQLSKEILREHYRETPWAKAVGEAKARAITEGVFEWKRLVGVKPEPLPSEYREAASQLYLAMANLLSGRSWFPGAWSLDQVISEFQRLKAGSAGAGSKS